MNRGQRIAFIQQVAGIRNAFDELENYLKSISRDELAHELLECGIIPEQFAHDSSEEKLWAKYCDILLNHVLNHLGIAASVIRMRGDSADVMGRTADYSIVGDAKAFRLSRTAKNQKDFKVSALDAWRRSDTYACLIAPLYQYPKSKSRIYEEAEARNVTLLSYVHLRFLLDHLPLPSLEPLWKTPGSIPTSQNATAYWNEIDRVVVALCHANDTDLQHYKKLELERTVTIGQEGITFWQSIVESYQHLEREEAIQRLIRAEKIDQKIRVIESIVSSVRNSYE